MGRNLVDTEGDRSPDSDSVDFMDGEGEVEFEDIGRNGFKG